MYAIIGSGGRQYQVEAGQIVSFNKLPAEPEDEIFLDNVLMYRDEDGVNVDPAFLGSVKVRAKVLAQDRDRKIRVFKKKRRKGFQKTIGHRQYLTRVRILSIARDGAETAGAPPSAEPEAQVTE
ncbi:MAG: 50S ribosomal protein L21 [Deltaproteobacteria bacterium]|nr:50S ribosomal protein L21 [Deltaproteobacteria bacterium]